MLKAFVLFMFSISCAGCICRNVQSPGVGWSGSNPKVRLASHTISVTTDPGGEQKFTRGEKFKITANTRFMTSEYDVVVGPPFDGENGGEAELSLDSDGITLYHGWAIGRLPYLRTNYVSVGSNAVGRVRTADRALALVELIYKADKRTVDKERIYWTERPEFNVQCTIRDSNANPKQYKGPDSVTTIEKKPDANGKYQCEYTPYDDICNDNDRKQFLYNVDSAVAPFYPEFQKCD